MHVRVRFIYFIAKSAMNFGSSIDAIGYLQLFLYGLGYVLAFAHRTTIGEGIARHRGWNSPCRPVLQCRIHSGPHGFIHVIVRPDGVACTIVALLIL